MTSRIPRRLDDLEVDPAVVASRLDRMDAHIAHILAAQERMSAAIEKLANLEASRKYCEDAVNDHESRIREIEIKMPMQQQTTDWVGRVVGGVIGGVGAAVLALVIK